MHQIVHFCRVCGPLQLPVLSWSDLPQRVRDWLEKKAAIERRSPREILMEILEASASEAVSALASRSHEDEET